jgi:hypothetical protein
MMMAMTAPEEPNLTPDEKRDSLALVKAFIQHDADAAKVILGNATRNGEMVIAAAMMLAANIHPERRQMMVEDIERTLPTL